MRAITICDLTASFRRGTAALQKVVFRVEAEEQGDGAQVRLEVRIGDDFAQSEVRVSKLGTKKGTIFSTSYGWHTSKDVQCATACGMGALVKELWECANKSRNADVFLDCIESKGAAVAGEFTTCFLLCVAA